MLGLASIVGTMSGAVDLQSLVTNPPFGSNATQTTTADPAQALEFRGTFVDGNERFFSIRETATRSSQWVGLKESGQPFLVESYDNAKGSIQVKYHNQVMTLTLKLAQILVQAVPVAPGPNAAPMPGAVTNSAPPNEAARLAQVAEEIRRRRALRAPGLVPQQNAAGNPPRPGPMPQQNVAGNPQYSGPMPPQNATGMPPGPGPGFPQITTGNPPGPGPVPTKP